MTQERSRDNVGHAQGELEGEHRELRGLVARLREARDVGELLPALELLHPALSAHFAHEEFPGGLYEAMGALGAAHSSAVRELVDDHYLFLAAVRGLTAAVRHHREGPIDDLLRQAAALATRLRAHEDKESALTAKLSGGT
jgi:hypothetical protein